MVDDKTQDSSDELLFYSRLVPDGREGNKIFARGCRQSNLVQIAMARIWQMAR